MVTKTNEFGQPVGPSLPGWTPPPTPAREGFTGRYCRLVPLAATHADALFDAFALDADAREWTYLPYGPFETRESFHRWVSDSAAGSDPLLFTIVPLDAGIPAGIAGYLRIAPQAGVIEVGHLRFSRHLQRTPAATEAMYLMMRRAFEMGYRRYEWKCDVFNVPSRAAATRLGFSFEGIFRQAIVYKGRSRDTAWFSTIDSEWPARRRVFETWLDPSNFDSAGRQKQRLSDLTRPLVVTHDPSLNTAP